MDRSAADGTQSRRELLAAGAGAAAGLRAGCVGPPGLSVELRQFDESDPVVTHDRVGKGSTKLSYWTSRFYMPTESGNTQPELSPLTGRFFGRSNSKAPSPPPRRRYGPNARGRAEPAQSTVPKSRTPTTRTGKTNSRHSRPMGRQSTTRGLLISTTSSSRLRGTSPTSTISFRLCASGRYRTGRCSRPGSTPTVGVCTTDRT